MVYRALSHSRPFIQNTPYQMLHQLKTFLKISIKKIQRHVGFHLGFFIKTWEFSLFVFLRKSLKKYNNLIRKDKIG